MIKVLFLDVDGTLTDGTINISSNGELYKSFFCKDGYGINEILPEYDIIPVVITGRQSEIVERRCREINIKHIYQGISCKPPVMIQVLRELGCTSAEAAYIGDDLNDLECMKICGFTGCPADAVREIKDEVDYICTNNGGRGAVREFIDYIVRHR